MLGKMSYFISTCLLYMTAFIMGHGMCMYRVYFRNPVQLNVFPFVPQVSAWHILDQFPLVNIM